MERRGVEGKERRKGGFDEEGYLREEERMKADRRSKEGKITGRRIGNQLLAHRHRHASQVYRRHRCFCLLLTLHFLHRR